MHRDKKIGFALGILLVGIVAAFFFRNEPDPFAELPPLDDPAALDALIAEKPITPYSPTANSPASDAPVSAAPKNPWELPEIYRRPEPSAAESAGLPISPGVPAPISLAEPVPAPPQDPRRAIEVGSPFGDPGLARPAPANDVPLPANARWTSVPEQPAISPKPPAGNLVEKTPPPVEKTPASPASLSSASLPSKSESTGTTYEVKPGDTLSVLAQKHLGSSRRFMEIYEANRDTLRNPDDIKVGMRIRIPPRVKFSDRPPLAESPKKAETIPAASEEAGRFMPFSHSPLAPVPR